MTAKQPTLTKKMFQLRRSKACAWRATGGGVGQQAGDSREAATRDETRQFRTRVAARVEWGREWDDWKVRGRE